MKKSKFLNNFSVFLLLICSFCLLGCDFSIDSFSGYVDNSVKDSMLVMIYMAGGNSLSDEAYRDIDFMEKGLYQLSGSERLKLNVVVLCDNKENGTELFEIQGDNTDWVVKPFVIQKASSSLGEWRKSSNQEENMGDINTLKNFIYWAKEKYSYCSKDALILWNHGSGLYSDYKHKDQRSLNSNKAPKSRMICTDEESGATSESLNNAIYMGELKNLLCSIYPEDKKLDFLGFDACLMGMYEIFYQFRDCVKYMTAAPASSLGGWNYEYIFSQKNTFESGITFAINAVDGYRKAYGPSGSNFPNTLTAVDLQFVKELKKNIDKLAASIDVQYNIDNYSYRSKLENAKKDSNGFVFYGGLIHSVTENRICYPHYDLGSILDNLERNSDLYSTDIIKYVKETRKILSKMVLKTWVSHSFVKIPGKKGDIYGANQPYGVSIFLSDENYFPRQGFYTDKTYETKGVIGYGGIDAANSTDDGIVNTWYELLVDLYGNNLSW